MVEVIERDWTDCYRDGWTSILHPDAFCHPAKVSRGLARRIYQHAIEQGWVRRGSVVVDPFAGIGGFALHAMQNGLHFVGVELEEKFVLLGQQNIDLWNERYGELLPGWGSATIVQGDSRRLVEVLQEANVLCSSPPFGNSANTRDEKFWRKHITDIGRDPDTAGAQSLLGAYSDNPHNLGNLPLLNGSFKAVLSSPPYLSGGNHTDQTGAWGGQGHISKDVAGYGKTEGQLAQMPKGDVKIVLSSPPYTATLGKGGETKGFHSYDENEAYNRCKRDYVEPGDAKNLGNLPEGDVEMICSSPPYAGLQIKTGKVDEESWSDGKARPVGVSQKESEGYGESDGQLGAMPEGDAQTILSSPPYAGIRQDGGRIASEGVGGFGAYTEEPPDTWHTQRDQRNVGNLREPRGDFEAILSSPPYVGVINTSREGPGMAGNEAQRERIYSGVESEVAAQSRGVGYGESEGQLGEMPMGILSSPPYADSMSSKDSGIDWSQCHREDGSLRDLTKEPAHVRRPGAGGEMRYGVSEGQLGKMSVVSSPPWEGSGVGGTDNVVGRNRQCVSKGRPPEVEQCGDLRGLEYGKSEGQLGKEQPETFWSAARIIMQQCYQMLLPGSHAIWVLKSFVRDKKIVDFPDQWRQLGESCGFETIEWIRAWLVEDRGAQYTLEGELEERKVHRMSFFRRLHTKKYPHLAIEYEVVLVQRKPALD